MEGYNLRHDTPRWCGVSYGVKISLLISLELLGNFYDFLIALSTIQTKKTKKRFKTTHRRGSSRALGTFAVDSTDTGSG